MLLRPLAAALILGCTGLASWSTATAAPTAPALTIASTSTTSFTARLTWDVDRAARVVVALGAGTEPAVWSDVVVAPAAGRFTSSLSPLEPATTYTALVTATSGGGRQSTAETSFRTGPMPRIAKSRVTPLGLKVNTRPLFPRMLFRQCPWAYPNGIAAGINVFMGTACGTPRQSMTALAGKGLLLPDVSSRADGASVIGWHQEDEVDLRADRPEAIPSLPPSSKTGRSTFLTFSNHVWSGAAQLPKADTLYPGLAARAEMIGVDLYPLQSFCNKNLLGAVYSVQRELIALAPGKPTYQWIEADPMGLCAGLDPSPAIVRAETWLAIAGGARGIGWFPDNWKPAVRAEITRLSTEIRSLAPALLGPEAAVSVAAPSKVVAGARTFHGATYVIAVNPTFARVGATVKVPVLGSGRRTLRVWGENRVVTAVNGELDDRFRGLQEHIYILPPSPWANDAP
jgi:hypothetical protein